MKENKSRNLNLDLLRVISCVAVVGLHTLKWDVSVLNSILYYLQGFAVPIFMMSSGYILVNREEITGEYTLKKILAVIKVVCFWNIVIFVLRSLYKCLIKRQIDLTIGDLFSGIYLSLIQKGIMWHFWYLGAMILLYLFALLLFQINQRKTITKKIWIVLALVSIIIQCTSYILHMPLQKNIIQTFRIWSWTQYFVLGGLMPIFEQQIKKKVSLKQHKILLILISIMIPIYQYILGNYVLGEAHAEYFYDDVLTIIWIVCLFTMVMRLHQSDKLCDYVSKLAPLTMGVYIIHTLFISVFSRFLPLNSFMNCIIVLILTIILSFIAAFIISKTPVIKQFISL